MFAQPGRAPSTSTVQAQVRGPWSAFRGEAEIGVPVVSTDYTDNKDCRLEREILT
jgi:hypothetical protein